MKFQGCVNFDVKFQTSTTNNYNEMPKSVHEKLSHFHMLKATCETTFTTYKIFFIEAPSTFTLLASVKTRSVRLL